MLLALLRGTRMRGADRATEYPDLTMRSTLAYTAARILLFVISLILLYLVGAHGLLLIGLALVISGIISYVVLSPQRDAMSSALAARLGSFRSRLDEGGRAEDDD
jgi:Protein of unknown function (DUF4229)